MAKTPQKEIVAHLLRQAGNRGVHTFELRQAYISNPSERIADLERAGWTIKHSPPEKLHGTAMGCRYVKVSEPDVESSPGGSLDGVPPASSVPTSRVALSAEPAALFEVEVPRPRAHYEEAA